MKNKTNIAKSLRFLTQPYTFIALIIYAINEFILQRYFPSWLSGKLSDFAWLFIAPVIITLLFSLILPTKRPNIVSRLAYSLTALFFIGVKTIPAMNDFILQSWLAIYRYPAAVVIDASDLLALLVLPISWQCWHNRMPTHKNLGHQTALIVSFFTLLTLADAPAPNSGVTLVAANDGKIIVDASYGYYCSVDGGFNWEKCDQNPPSMYEGLDYQQLPISIQIPNSQIQYRITEKGFVQISEDAGSNWHNLPTENYLSDVMRYYQQQIHSNAYVTNPGAQDITYDPVTGNVIVAMGLQGVVVIPRDGKAIQVGIGDNQPVNLSASGVAVSILFPFLLLALTITVILFTCIIIGAKQKSYFLLNFITILAWAYLVMNFPDLFSGYAIVIGFPILLVVLALTIWGLFYANKELNKMGNNKKHHIINNIVKTFPAGLIFFLCYVLWYLNVIPNLQKATIISFGVILIWFIYCIVQSYQLKKTQAQ